MIAGRLLTAPALCYYFITAQSPSSTLLLLYHCSLRAQAVLELTTVKVEAFPDRLSTPVFDNLNLNKGLVYEVRSLNITRRGGGLYLHCVSALCLPVSATCVLYTAVSRATNI